MSYKFGPNEPVRLAIVRCAREQLDRAVVELSEGVSQLLIAGRSRPNEEAASSQIVTAVMRICAEMKKTCELAR